MPVLTGEITGISVQPIGFNEQQFASRYLFIMTMKVQLTDARDEYGPVVQRCVDVP